jgi:hypothetical protein
MGNQGGRESLRLSAIFSRYSEEKNRGLSERQLKRMGEVVAGVEGSTGKEATPQVQEITEGLFADA